MGSTVRLDGTAYVKDYQGGYRSEFKNMFVWQNKINGIEPFDDLISKIIAGRTRIQKLDERNNFRRTQQLDERDGKVERGGVSLEEYIKICEYFLRAGA